MISSFLKKPSNALIKNGDHSLARLKNLKNGLQCLPIVRDPHIDRGDWLTTVDNGATAVGGGQLCAYRSTIPWAAAAPHLKR